MSIPLSSTFTCLAEPPRIEGSICTPLAPRCRTSTPGMYCSTSATVVTGSRCTSSAVIVATNRYPLTVNPSPLCPSTRTSSSSRYRTSVVSETPVPSATPVKSVVSVLASRGNPRLISTPSAIFRLFILFIVRRAITTSSSYLLPYRYMGARATTS